MQTEDLKLQNSAHLRKSAPSCLLHSACHAKCIFAGPLQMSHACHRFWKCCKTLTFCSRLEGAQISCACHAKPHLNLQKWFEHVVSLNILNWKCASHHNDIHCTFSTSQLPKVVRSWCALHILTWKCASHHNSVHFFDVSTSKSGPTLVCFVRFDFEMCLLRAITACTFSTSQIISTFKSAPKLRCFVRFDFEICFAPQWPDGQAAPHPPLQQVYFSTRRSHKSFEKRCVSRHFYLFAHLHLLSSDSFSSLIFSLLLFSCLL